MSLVNQAQQGGQMIAYLQQYKDLKHLALSGGYYNPAVVQQGYALQKVDERWQLQMARRSARRSWPMYSASKGYRGRPPVRMAQ